MPARLLVSVLFFLSLSGVYAASSGRGTVAGVVKDQSGAVIPAASVHIHNPITGHEREVRTDDKGEFRIADLPYNSYHLHVSQNGFSSYEHDLDIRRAVPLQVEIQLLPAGAASSIRVEAYGTDVLENVPYAHYDVDHVSLSKLPLTNPASGLSDAVTMSTPGVVADSNGLFHPLGDHAQASFVVDGQPINDQQSKQFSTQLPLNAIQSMELITGGVSAEYGDKTSLVINAQTRNGLDSDGLHGRFAAHYGSFGTIGEEGDLGWGGKKLGNFLVFNSGRSGRFLDTPEFRPHHAVGNNGVIFDRIDFRPNERHAFHLNLFGARNWFQVPNSLDQLNQDQRQRNMTWSVAPGYTNVINERTVWTTNAFARQDHLNYYPSRNPESDWPASISQRRTLTNYGLKSEIAHSYSRHDVKAGFQLMQTRLNERFSLSGDHTDPLDFRGKGNVNQLAVYLQDSVRLGSLTLNGGLRVDAYRGLSRTVAVQPRVGASYLVKPTGTIIRFAYSRTLETPYNENLLLASSGGVTLQPGRRNQINGGIQQAIGRWAQIDVDYFWKRTSNASDFEALGNSPLVFPISMRQSKIDGFAVRFATANWRGFQAYTVMGSSRARYFGPLNGGLHVGHDHDDHDDDHDHDHNHDDHHHDHEADHHDDHDDHDHDHGSGLHTGIIGHDHDNAGVFRIDHDQKFQQTTFLRYQYKNGPWVAFTWRYDHGLVAGPVSNAENIFMLTGAQQAAMGLYCGNVWATPGSPISSCGQALQASRIRIPAPGTADADHNPARIAPRHLFNVSVGTENLFRTERYRTTLRFTASNLTNRVSLYNFLSTFSGTHFVAPRSYVAEVGFRF